MTIRLRELTGDPSPNCFGQKNNSNTRLNSVCHLGMSKLTLERFGFFLGFFLRQLPHLYPMVPCLGCSLEKTAIPGASCLLGVRQKKLERCGW